MRQLIDSGRAVKPVKGRTDFTTNETEYSLIAIEVVTDFALKIRDYSQPKEAQLSELNCVRTATVLSRA
ncbi:MAG: hypothetical protein MK110_12395 [Fuerstiella sp.]|nr:hypothetical protein [Fuerstiella sp.]